MNGQADNTAVTMNQNSINYVCNLFENIQLKFNSKTYITTRNRKYEPNNNGSRYKRSLNKLSTDTTDRHKYITNLSTKTLTQCQSKVLTKGLAFIPSTHMNKSRLNDTTRMFQRSNRLKHYFRDSVAQEVHPFRQKSTWMPPRASDDVEKYLQRIEKDIGELEPTSFFPNMTRAETKALKELAANPDIVIKNADKGSGIVIEDREKYIADGKEHLEDKNIYRMIDADPTLQLAKAINKYTSRMLDKGIIDSTTHSYLHFKQEQMPRTQQLYFLKKIHKNPIAVRPIVSGCGGPTEKISQLVDLHLQPHVKKIDSYIKDTNHIIDLIENTTIPNNCILATIDVKALYLNIPHRDGIEAVLNRLYRNNPDSDDVEIPPETMRDLLNIVLTKNYFQFADSMYHQVQGTAMGTKMAPAYANLFMAELEERLLDNYHIKPVIWKRYIDDVLCVWPDTEQELEKFMNYLNSSHDTIKFTYEHSKDSIDFLDTTIYKGDRHDREQKLDIKPFFKKTNKFQYLQYSSAHPKTTFSSLIKGEMTRLLRACSDEQTYRQIQKKMYDIFRDRDYPSHLIKEVQRQVDYHTRPNIIAQREREQCPYDTFFVTEYTSDLDVKKLKSIIKPNPTEEGHVPKPCLSLKKTRTLGNTLVRAKVKGQPKLPITQEEIVITTTPSLGGHSACCGIAGCKCCPIMSKKQRVTSSHDHKSFPTPKQTNCSNRNVIYLLECMKCKTRNQYVGQTQRQLSQRMAGHRAASRTKTNLPIYKHFLKLNHSLDKDIRLTILERCRADQLDDRERHWINTLQTVFPKGLNSRFE